MNIDVLTIFPEMFDPFLAHGMVRRGIEKEKVAVSAINIRDFAEGRHRMTDDRPYGGGCGMVMKPEPLAAAIRKSKKEFANSKTVLLTPQGRTFDQETADQLVDSEGLILVCGRYEGVDERIASDFVDYEVSIGDFILTGGELAAMVVIDAVVRLIPGVLGGSESAEKESFSEKLLEHAHFTRPRVFEGEAVPDVLQSGNHKEIEKWRLEESLIRTFLKGGIFWKIDRWRMERSRSSGNGRLLLKKSSKANLYLALIHHPVVNKKGAVIASAITNLDLHDIARAAKTYGAKTFYVVTPLADQQVFADRIVTYWAKGAGATYNPDRKEALDLISIRSSLDEVVGDIKTDCHVPPYTVATCARLGFQNLGSRDLREKLESGHPCLLMFGTAWGLADELLADADFVLDPITGPSDYNHLSVRSAAAILLDRLMGDIAL